MAAARTQLLETKATWHNPRILLLLLAVFLCGGAAGALTARLAARRAPATYWKEGGRELTLDRMKKDLDLTPQQAAEIETVLDEFVLYYQNLQGQMDDFRSEGKSRILRVLTPEQKQKFERMMNQLTARLR